MDVLRATVVMGLSSLVAPTVALGADCASSRTTADLTAQLEAAEATYGQLDVAGFRDAMDRARQIVPCLEDEFTRHTAAELHRFEGLLAFVDRDPEQSTAAFAAARAIEPHYRFPETLVPSGNPVLQDYEAIDPRASKVEVLDDPVDGRLVLDGRTSNQRPLSIPTVFQLVQDDGRVAETSYLRPGDPVPTYKRRPSAQVAVTAASDPVSGGSGAASVVRRGPDKRFLIGAGGAMMASALLYGGAFAVHQRYDDPTTDIERLNSIRATNNTLVMASGATAVIGVGLGATAFFVARF